MKLHLVTLLSELENLNRWNLNSSVSLVLNLNGLTTGKNTVEIGFISLNVDEKNIVLRDHEQEELSSLLQMLQQILNICSHLAEGELWGVASRTDFDLKAHAEHSGEAMDYFDPTTNEKYVPYCIEPSLGADRVTLAFLCEAYDEEEIGEGDVRTVLHFHPALAPFKAAVLTSF